MLRYSASCLVLFLILTAIVFICFPASAARIGVSVLPGVRCEVDILSVPEIQFDEVVKQKLDTSCGSAALATILRYYYQEPVSEEEIILGITGGKGVPPSGFSLLDLKVEAERRGYTVYGLKGTVEALRQLEIPFIVLLRFGDYAHFVVVKQVSEKVYIGDPALGNLVIDIEEFRSRWNGILLLIVGNNASANAAFRRPKYMAPASPDVTVIQRFLRMEARDWFSDPEEF